MEYAITGFYPAFPGKKSKNLIGTLEVKIVEIGMTIRGVRVFALKNSFYFKLPISMGYNEEEKRVKEYCIVKFDEQDTLKNLIAFLKIDFPKRMHGDLS